MKSTPNRPAWWNGPLQHQSVQTAQRHDLVVSPLESVKVLSTLQLFESVKQVARSVVPTFNGTIVFRGRVFTVITPWRGSQLLKQWSFKNLLTRIHRRNLTPDIGERVIAIQLNPEGGVPTTKFRHAFVLVLQREYAPYSRLSRYNWLWQGC